MQRTQEGRIAGCRGRVLAADQVHDGEAGGEDAKRQDFAGPTQASAEPRGITQLVEQDPDREHREARVTHHPGGVARKPYDAERPKQGDPGERRPVAETRRPDDQRDAEVEEHLVAERPRDTDDWIDGEKSGQKGQVLDDVQQRGRATDWQLTMLRHQQRER